MKHVLILLWEFFPIECVYIELFFAYFSMLQSQIFNVANVLFWCCNRASDRKIPIGAIFHISPSCPLPVHANSLAPASYFYLTIHWTLQTSLKKRTPTTPNFQIDFKKTFNLGHNSCTTQLLPNITRHHS
uniref:Uncharacterized protein n=1 Tax=Setaria viridis TaxID=4556 RepID=A0A4U6W2X3_SETVI|nr:hypothetical protein SEVIR_2G337500v2 [Setaria viridis]